MGDREEDAAVMDYLAVLYLAKALEADLRRASGLALDRIWEKWSVRYLDDVKRECRNAGQELRRQGFRIEKREIEADRSVRVTYRHAGQEHRFTVSSSGLKAACESKLRQVAGVKGPPDGLPGEGAAGR